MTQGKPAAAATPKVPKPLWPTATGLVVLFLGCLYLERTTESSMVAVLTALLSLPVTLGGVLGHGLVGLGRAFRRRGPLARNSFSRAGLYLAFGVASVASPRLQCGNIDRFRADLRPGTSIQETLRRLDIVYTQHPKNRSLRFIRLCSDSSAAVGAAERRAESFAWWSSIAGWILDCVFPESSPWLGWFCDREIASA